MVLVVLLNVVFALGMYNGRTPLEEFRFAVLSDRVAEVSSYLLSLEPLATDHLSSRNPHILHSLPRLVGNAVRPHPSPMHETLTEIRKLAPKVAELGLAEMTILLTDFYAENDLTRAIKIDEVISRAALQAIVHDQMEVLNRISELPYFAISVPRVRALLDTSFAYDRMEALLVLLDKGLTSAAVFKDMNQLSPSIRPDILTIILDHAGVANLPYWKDSVSSLVREGNLEALSVLLQYPGFSHRDKKALGDEVFMRAVEAEQFPKLKYLTEHRMVSVFEKDLLFGLNMALARSTPAIVRFLLESDPQVSQSTVEMVATWNPRSAGFSVVLDHNPSLLNPLSLIHAATSGNLQLVRLLVQRSTDSERIYALHMAAISGHSEVVKLLLESTSPSHLALRQSFLYSVLSGSVATASVLISHEITPSEVGQALGEVLYPTLDPDMWRFLLDTSNIPAAKLHTILKEALTYRMKDVVFEVLSKFPGFMTSPEFSTKYMGELDTHGVENTLLHAIACAGYIDSVTLIVASGADTSTLNSAGETFLEYAGSYKCAKKDGLALYEKLTP